LQEPTNNTNTRERRKLAASKTLASRRASKKNQKNEWNTALPEQLCGQFTALLPSLKR